LPEPRAEVCTANYKQARTEAEIDMPECDLVTFDI